MLTLYRLALWFYLAGIYLASPFSSKARKWILGRRNWKSKLRNCNLSGKIVWIHCASLGEHEQARPLMEALTQADPSVRIVLTFFSSTGYEHRKDDPLASAVFYLPFDSDANARYLVETLKPDLAIFVKYEFWYYTLRAIVRAHIPLILISAHFRPDQFTGMRKEFYGQMFRSFDYIFVQDERSQTILEEEYGMDRVSVAGDTRYDRVARIAQQSKPIPETLKRFVENKKVILCGSTWPLDEQMLAQCREYLPTQFDGQDCVWIIAPHEPGVEAAKRIKKLFGTQARTLAEQEKDFQPTSVLIVNQLGLLSRLYSVATVCWIGGGFGTGIHNVLEAAVFGIPILFGPNYKKFNEACELIEAGGAWSFGDVAEAASCMKSLLTGEVSLARIGELNIEFVDERVGATDEIIRWLDHEQIIELEE